MRRHENMKTIAFNIAALVAVLLLFEGAVRYFVTYNPSYYMGTKAAGSCIPHPYGEVCLNSFGYPDDEFDLASAKPRVGYFGDSVCYGVGAGRGYRLTDRLKTYFTEYGHFNFCNIGDSTLSDQTMGNIRRFAEGYQLSHVVLLMNLNDIPPLMAELHVTHSLASESQEPEHIEQGQFWMVKIKQLMAPIDLQLRGRSYLYTHLRNKIKERLTVAGYGHNGYRAIELFPDGNREVFRYAAQKISGLARDLRSQGITLRVVLLPYEMQVSARAAEAYRRLHIDWEPGFEHSSAQLMIISFLDAQVRYFDAYHAFDGYREQAALGEYFVYDKGDKIDWNHPNREGHRLIADYLIRERVLSSPAGGGDQLTAERRTGLRS